MNVQIFKCFIASPSDTSKEREACENVFTEINNTLGEQLNFRIESKKWEKDSRPGFGEDGQDVINEQLLNTYHLFIGIMWNKFGTPTKNAQSGTEAEFQHAYSRLQNEDDDLEILFYFNEEPANASNLELKQLEKVRGFRKKISDLGGLYGVYEGVNDFEGKLKRHLNDYFVGKMGSKQYRERTIESDGKSGDVADHQAVATLLKSRLNDSLSTFSDQPFVWIEPILSRSNEISNNADENYKSKVDIADFVESPKSTIIKSPPLFGLTSLANYLVCEAWDSGFIWIYLDFKDSNNASVDKLVKRELKRLDLGGSPVDCIILDSWISSEPGSKKFLKAICSTFKDTPIIVMQTISDSSFEREEENEVISREFEVLHLLALPRTKIREMVSTYNNEIKIAEEDIVLEKVIKDLNVLNIHRTPLNCITLLKVSEKYFDESPVNRTKMIELVLFVLFDLGEVPTYKSKPDVKDCEYVLGRFCERMIKEQQYQFTHQKFHDELDAYCKERLLHLEVSVVFDILYSNHIIVARDSEYCFRASHWIYYFVAKRMHLDKEFCDYVVQRKLYTSFPEIIEFYTGVDRNRTDILEVLTKELCRANDEVGFKTGLPEELNPLLYISWAPEADSLIEMEEELSEDIQESKLPDAIKDQHADKNYNQLRPYDQSVQIVLEEYSVVVLMQNIRASCRALRNSDYAEPDIKLGLFREITRGWRQVSNILFALAPTLASNGFASIEGQSFTLLGYFGDSIEQKVHNIMQANPYNIVSMFKDDLFSNKMGPLLLDFIDTETDEMVKHQLILLLIFERPIGWRKKIEDYIATADKNSFYLYNSVLTLRGRYRFDFATDKELSDIAYLIKMGIAKHEFGGAKPGIKEIKKISNRVVPKRSEDK